MAKCAIFLKFLLQKYDGDLGAPARKVAKALSVVGHSPYDIYRLPQRPGLQFHCP